jgi:hypothetical protein
MRVTFYIGQPGTGKTTLVRGLLSEFRKVETDELVVEGMVKYHKFEKQKVLVLGIYDESTFAGTDRLCRSIGPKFREWLVANAESYTGWELVMEGERFMNDKTLPSLFEQESMKLVCLKVSEEELVRRREARNNTQNETWLKGMTTRVANVCDNYCHEEVYI